MNLGAGATPLPATAARDEPHVPVLVSKNLEKADRIVVYIGESHQDLGILAGRVINEEGVNLGSAVNFVHDVIVDPSCDQAATKLELRGTKKLKLEDLGNTAVVIANPGQLIWWRRGKKALTYESWNAVPRKHGPGDGPMLTEKNKVPRNKDRIEHVQCLFDDILFPHAQSGVKIDVITVGDSMDSLVRVLDGDWNKWSGSVEAIACISTWIFDQEIMDEEFRLFWGRRARTYLKDDAPLGTPMTGREELGCNVYSTGPTHLLEGIMPRHYKVLLDYFKLVRHNPTYANTPQDIPNGAEEIVETSWGMGGEDDVNIDIELDGEDESAAIDAAVSDGLGKVADVA